MAVRTFFRLVVAGLLLAVAATQLAQAAGGRTGPGQGQRCDRVSAPGGTDRGPGTMRRPFRTAGQLITHLGPGQTGCLLGGVYEESLVFVHGGATGKPMVLTSAGRKRATIAGFVEVADSAPYVTLQNLKIDGSSTTQQTVQLFAADTVLRRVDVTNDHKGGSCIQLGNLDFGIATRNVIDHSRVHGCGLNPSAGGDHGVYVGASDGGRITNNVILDSAGFGIQLYPDAQNTLIKDNLVYGSGAASVIFAGSDDHASSRNVVTRNVLAGAAEGYAVTFSWDGPTGSGNLLVDNCIWNGGRPAVAEQSGFSAKSNRIARPQFEHGSAGARQRRSSPCRKYGPR